ncbi:MAG: hypothetical protein IK052_01275 [Bacteroidales bacterium]|nr:hypothetical protein [Bacteroidales bacterium]
MNINRIACKLVCLAQVMMEEGIMDPLTFNSFSADDFYLDCRRLTVSFPWGGTIQFNPMEMSLYVFFLRHPRGVRKEDMWQHYSELLELYRKITVSIDPERMEDAIDGLCDTLATDNFISHVSHIRVKLAGQLGELVSLRFAINRTEDGLYRIAALRG